MMRLDYLWSVVKDFSPVIMRRTVILKGDFAIAGWRG